MKERFADAAEEDGRPGRYLGHAVQDTLEGLLRHLAHGRVPALAHAGAAVDIAAVGGFEVDLGQVSGRPVQAQVVLLQLDARPGAGGQAVGLDHFGRYNQPPLFVHLSPQNVRCLHIKPQEMPGSTAHLTNRQVYPSF
jgi:hypothetical protein